VERYGVLLDMLPVFVWTPSVDHDRFDTARYTLLLANNDNFAAADTMTGLSDTNFTVVDSLHFGDTYYWKVQAYDKFGGITPSDQVFTFTTWLLGDANSDGAVNVGDAVFLITYIFKDGAAPVPLRVGDINGDCAINVGDAVALVNYIFKDGPPPEIGCE
jgi:hypothetical protein